MASLALNLKTKPGPHKNYTSWPHVLADCALDISEGTLQWTTTVGSVCEGIWGGLEVSLNCPGFIPAEKQIIKVDDMVLNPIPTQAD